MTNYALAVAAEIHAAVDRVKGVFESDKREVAADIKTKVSDAVAAAEGTVKDATPEIKAAVSAATKAISQAVLVALAAHGL